MNTYFDFFAFVFLFVLPYTVAVIAFRIIRKEALTRFVVYQWVSGSSESYWQYHGMAKNMNSLKFTWAAMELVNPLWFLPLGKTPRKDVGVVQKRSFNDTDDHFIGRFLIDDTYYLIVDQGRSKTLLLAIFIAWIIVTPIVMTFWLNAHPGAFVSAEPTVTPAPTATQVAVSTSAPRPTGTPEIQVTDGGDSIIINLDEQAPSDALLEWINGLQGPDLPGLPSTLEEWLNSLPWPEVAAIQMPEGMDGYVVVARWRDGFELVRLDQYGNPVGGPVALKDTKDFTLHARELKWGVRYNDKFRVTNEGQGHIDVYVTESDEPPMATGYHMYNFRLWHIAIVIVLIIVGIVAYRKIYY